VPTTRVVISAPYRAATGKRGISWGCPVHEAARPGPAITADSAAAGAGIADALARHADRKRSQPSEAIMRRRNRWVLIVVLALGAGGTQLVACSSGSGQTVSTRGGSGGPGNGGDAGAGVDETGDHQGGPSDDGGADDSADGGDESGGPGGDVNEQK
jgi:hypothetical protein